ncbi:MAG: RimK family protein [Candidatus Sumerlaeaceae bacterium]
MNIILVLNTPGDWPLLIPGVEVVAARDYLTHTKWSTLRSAKVFNLCKSYKYQSVGYYVSLLAEARTHRPLPSLTTIQDLKSHSLVRVISDDLHALIQRSLGALKSDKFTLSIYFGRNVARQYDKLALQLFNLFQAPLLRAQFVRHEDGIWEMRSIGAIAASDVPDEHWLFVMDVGYDHFQGRRVTLPRPKTVRYNFAILHNPIEPEPPSDAKALQKFIKAGEALDCTVELITREDYDRVPEFDALFIRETTSVHHHTYRFARRAEAEGLVVIDDPTSILRCCNKVYLAEVLERHKIATPRTLIVHRDNVDDIIPTVGLPCILKRPDSSFSRGVVKIEDEDQLRKEVADFLTSSDLLIAQEFLPTEFDWRIGIFDRKPLYACRYHMFGNHWQIVKDDTRDGTRRWGKVETLPVELAPKHIVKAALAAANLIGNGLYGVDAKDVGRRAAIIEVNENPSIEAGYEDSLLKDELYARIMGGFLQRVEAMKAGRRA